MLKSLYAHTSLNEAAKESAGNWKNWSHFVWFGSDDIPNSHNVMLGYLLGPQSTVVDIANSEVVKEKMKPFMGDMLDPTQTVDNFGSSFHGDANALSGLMIRVYDDNGAITDAFKALYELAQKYMEACPLDDAVFDIVNRRELMRYVGMEVDALCRDKGVAFTGELTAKIVDVLIEQDIDFDSVDCEEIEQAFDEVLV